MDRIHWEVYAIIRKLEGKVKADDYKRKIRVKYNKSKRVETVNPWKVVFSDFDGFTKKRFFPYFFTTEEWEEFVENEWINIYSPYDCTGEVFSVSLERYEINGGTWVYHTLGLDI